MSSVLVTGGAGYVGSQSVLHFQSLGWRVVVIDDLSTGHVEYAALADGFVEASLLDRGAVEAALASEPFDGVLHCAARALVIESMDRPLWYLRQNVVGSLNLIEAAIAAGGVPVVFSSSGTVYGIQGEEPIAETAPPRPINPYGLSKWHVEQAFAEADRAHGLRSVSLRYFNAAGADPACRVGERHDPETHLIPNLLRSSGTFRVCGDRFPTRDGTCLRDYIHTQDLARAHAAALEHLWAGASTEIVNCGSGTGATILEMMAAAERVLRRPIAHEVVEARPGDPPSLVADIAKIGGLWGWKPEHSSLDEILGTALEWHRKDGWA